MRRHRTVLSNVPIALSGLAALLLALVSSAPADAQTNVRLYGVTGDGAEISEALFTLSLTDGSPTFVMDLGHGDDGETIAFNPDDGRMYHLSGHATACSGGDLFDCNIFESIDLDALTTTNIDISGNALSDEENIAITYEASSGTFLVAQNHFTPQVYFRVTTAGVPTVLGSIDHQVKGLAYSLDGSTLYTVDQSSTRLRTINPATGATLTSIPMTGISFSGANGLATHPVTGALYVLLRAGGGGGGEGDADDGSAATESDPSAPAPIHDADGNIVDSELQVGRLLAIVNPATGALTAVGDTRDSFAGLAFAFDPVAPRGVGGFEVGVISPAVTGAVGGSGDWAKGLGLAAVVLVLVLGAAVVGVGRRGRSRAAE